MEILARADQDLTITEISHALKVHRTIGHRLVATLEQRDLVYRTPGGGYRLGAGLIRLAGAINRDLRAVARPFLAELNAQTDETVHLAVLSRAQVFFIDCHESSKALRVVSRAGRAYPVHSTSVGKAMLAALDDGEVLPLLPNPRLEKLTAKTIASRSELLGQLAIIRERGYAMSAQEAEEGVGSVAVAIRDRQRALRGALSIAAPVVRFTPAAVTGFARALQGAAQAVGERI